MKRCLSCAALIAASVCGQFARADLVALWTFETSVPTTAGAHIAEEGFFATSSFASTNSGGIISNPPGNGSAESFSSNGWNDGEYYQFLTSSMGFRDLTVSYAQAASTTGPGDFQFQYSIDGVNFTNFGSLYAGPTGDFQANSFSADNVLNFDLSTLPTLNNQSAIGFRVAVAGTRSKGDGTIAGGGTFRIDDFSINATAVPEPSSCALWSLVVSAVICYRRQRR